MTELAARPAIPDTNVVPAVWGRITNLVVERGEGSWLVTTDGERYLDYSSGIGVTSTGHAHPRVVAAIQAQAAKLLHGQQNIVYHEAGLPPLRPPGPSAARRSLVRVPVQLRRRGRRGRGQARPRRHRPAGDHRVPLRLPRPDRPDDGADDRQGRLPRRLRTAAGLRLPHGVPVLLPRVRRRPRPGRLHVRLGGAAGPAVPPARLPGPGGGDHRGAGDRRGRLPRPAARLPAAPPRDHPRARDPAHRRRGPDGLRADGRDVRRAPLGRGAGHPGHGQGHRVRAAAVGDPRPRRGHGGLEARQPRRHVRRQRRRVRGGARHPRRDRGRGGWSATRPSGGSSSWTASASSRRSTRRSATSVASASWWRSSSSSPATATAACPMRR